MEGLLTSQQLTALEDILKIILLPPAVCIAVYMVQRWLCRTLWGTKVKLIPSMVLSVLLLSFVCKLWMWQQKGFSLPGMLIFFLGTWLWSAIIGCVAAWAVYLIGKCVKKANK